ncbi:MAG: NF038122 family metalloprotease [Bryobacterales bacterium]|nr:NF038122 family metalloprotease [Bryobacterales bacterium]
MVITLSAGSTLLASSDAMAAFDRAASRWEELIANNTNIVIQADFGALSGGILATSYPTQVATTYSELRTLLISSSAGEPDSALFNALPESRPDFALPPGFTASNYMNATKANLKALGAANLDQLYGPWDGSITFGTGYSYSYLANGVEPGKYDFESIVFHEIGHTLGFMSAVDKIVGRSSGSVDPTLFDLFRFPSTGIPDTLSEFGTSSRSLKPTDSTYWSDGASSYALSSGISYQASHWASSAIGIMDPTVSQGVKELYLTTADRSAFSSMGWDLSGGEVHHAPEPATLFMLPLGASLFLAARRVRQKRSRAA